MVYIFFHVYVHALSFCFQFLLFTLLLRFNFFSMKILICVDDHLKIDIYYFLSLFLFILQVT